MIMFSVVIIEKDYSKIGSKVRTVNNIFPLYDKDSQTIEFIQNNQIVETFRMDNIENISISIREY